MKKYVIFALFLFFVVAAFSGTVAAEPTADSWFVDDQDNEITSAQVGDDVEYLAWVTNDENPETDVSAEVEINSDVAWGEPYGYSVSWDGGATWVDDDPSVTRIGNVNYWDIGDLAANQEVVLNFYGRLLNAGSEEYIITLFDAQGVPIDESVATLLVTAPTTSPQAAAETGRTVGMQTTGSPVGILLLAFGLITAGLAYSKKY